jgi:ParB-like chromosome segregation protein Spo0J
MIRDGLVGYHSDLRPLLQPIDSVTPHPDNPNNGDLEAITQSIQVNGMYRPVFTQAATGRIIAGNHTWTACKELGAQQIPVVALDVDDTTAVRIMLADNQVAHLAQPDPGLLLHLLDNLDTLHGTGYTDHDLDVLTALAEIPLQPEVATWPLLTFRVPPHVQQAFYDLTDAADSDRDRFELLLRLAGWDR